MMNSAEFVDYGWRLIGAHKKPSRFTDFSDTPGSIYLEYVLTIEKVHHIYYSFVDIPAFGEYWLALRNMEYQ